MGCLMNGVLFKETQEHEETRNITKHITPPFGNTLAPKWEIRNISHHCSLFKVFRGALDTDVVY